VVSVVFATTAGDDEVVVINDKSVVGLKGKVVFRRLESKKKAD